jgi:hypothetical protein
MECSLQHLLNKKTNFTLEQKIEILEEICLGIQYLHNETNIIHKDIKPSNVLVNQINGRYHTKICDFGISKRMDLNKTTTFQKTNEVKFTLMYVPPEYYNNKEVSRSGDIYSLGSLMHTVLFGIHPYDGMDKKEIMDNIENVFYVNFNSKRKKPTIQEEWTTDIPKELVEVVKSCLNIDKTKRCEIDYIIKCIDEIKNADSKKEVKIQEFQFESLSLESGQKLNCVHGGKCDELDNIIHLALFIHPDDCNYGGNCKNLSDENHLISFVHPQLCESGGRCTNFSEFHYFNYLHPPECIYNGICTNYEYSHDILYRHPLMCKLGRKCDNNDFDHLIKCSHPKNKCIYGSFCVDISINHQKFYSHPFLPICRNGLLCGNKSTKHRERYTHACPHGYNCIRMDSNSHLKNHLHLKKICKYGDACLSINERNHISNYLHPLDKSPYKIVCEYGLDCKDREYEHIMMFSHPNYSFGLCEVFHWNRGIDFRKNKEYLDQLMAQEYVDKILLSKVSSYVKKNFHPVHRCTLTDLKEMLRNGFLSNQNLIKKFKLNPDNLALKMINHSTRISEIKKKNKCPQDDEIFEKLTKKIVNQKHLELRGDINQMNLLSSISKDIGMMKNSYSKNFNEKDLETCVDLIKHFADLTFPRDLKVESEEMQIKSIIGHHTGYDEGEIIIVFSQCIMNHPDFSMTPHSSKLFLNKSTFERRYWANDSSMDNTMKYQSSKLNASVTGWEETFAKEMILQHWDHQNTITSIKDLENSLKENQFEGLLPSLISFDFIEKIILPVDKFNELTKDEKYFLTNYFGYKENGDGIVKYNQKYDKLPILQLKEKYLYQTKHNLSGYSVSIQKNSEIVIPHSIKESHFQISMDVKGDEFALFLMSEEKDICYSIIVMKGKSKIQKHGISQYPVIIGENVDHKRADNQHFTGLLLSYKNGSIMLKSGIYVNAKDQFPQNIKYFGISCFGKLICFENIEIK